MPSWCIQAVTLWGLEQILNKEQFIKMIEELPDNIQIFATALGEYKEIDVKIFTEPKDKDFLKFYFGP